VANLPFIGHKARRNALVPVEQPARGDKFIAPAVDTSDDEEFQMNCSLHSCSPARKTLNALAKPFRICTTAQPEPNRLPAAGNFTQESTLTAAPALPSA